MPSGYGMNQINKVHTFDETVNMIIRLFSDTEIHLEVIMDHNWLLHLVNNASFLAFFKNMKLHNINIMIVCEIDKENANYSKRLIKFSDLRHSNGLKGCSFANERLYCFFNISENGLSDASFESKPSENSIHHLYIENTQFVKQQNLLFKYLWRDSMTVSDKITEIEKEVKKEILKIESKSGSISKPKEILFRIMESCVDQILILIPSTNLFWSFYQSNLLVLISNLLTNDVTSKILIHLDDNQLSVKDEIRHKLKETSRDLDINTNFFSKRIPQSHISIIVDHVVLIEIDYNNEGSMELKDKFSPQVVFSIDDTRLLSSASVFDILWIESDMERQQKIKQTYFDIFKGFNLKSENYKRNWNFEKKNNK